MTAIEKLIATARNEIGYLEKASNSNLDSKTANAGRANYTKYARDLAAIGDWYNFSKQGFEWCTQFVDWCLVQTFGVDLVRKMKGLPKSSLGASCTQTVKYYKAINRFSKTPQVGAQIFFGKAENDCEHTGIVVKVTSSQVTTIEGNTSGANGVIANGGGVCEKTYSRSSSYIVGYGMPKYELYIEEEDEDMVRYKTLSEMPAAYQPTISKLIKAGVIAGKSDGNLDLSEDMVRCIIYLDRMTEKGLTSTVDAEKISSTVSTKLLAKLSSALEAAQKEMK